ncbi:hypothetical protein [Hymenobacter sp. APR13]|uniref:hypothetical protein n=1 Tax=Hymenobacter sp. APR13 TaxID=1356852 RepID=UPI0004E049A1|nr:hypothetical protein [Hymenobacter sp. APR13]AII52941.1 hypothetical protein N008_13265 [Hymenobacter sp. APR13]
MHTFSTSILRAALPATAGALLLLAGCSPDQPVPALSSNGLDLTRYLAVGDSYTAGFADGGLTSASQSYSYANLIAGQFAKVDANATFTQPLLADGAGTGYLTLAGFEANGLPRTTRVKPAATLARFVNTTGCNGADTLYLYPRAGATLPQNLGVSGLRLSQISIAGLGNTANLTRIGLFNPYFERLLPANDNRTYLQVVTTASANASFFTFFAGLDDLLPYVVSGGNCGPLPSASTLTANARLLLAQLSAGGRAGVVALPPSLATLPVLRLSRGLDVQQRLRQNTATANDTLFVRAFTGAIQVVSGEDYVLPSGQRRIGRLESVTGAPQTRPYGSRQNPVSGADVLDYLEVARISQVAEDFRTGMAALANTTFKLPLIDTNDALFSQVAGNININGVNYTPELVRGNFYSLDRTTLTPRGNALLANVFLRKINESYNTSIPLINVNNLPTQANP